MNLFEAANRYLQQSDWKTMALLKFCLVSVGVCIGMFVPKSFFWIFLAVFIVTYIPLMKKFFNIIKEK